MFDIPSDKYSYDIAGLIQILVLRGRRRKEYCHIDYADSQDGDSV